MQKDSRERGQRQGREKAKNKIARNRAERKQISKATTMKPTEHSRQPPRPLKYARFNADLPYGKVLKTFSEEEL